MPKCMVCKKGVVSGYVLCSHCAKSLEPQSLPAKLAFVLDQLAEEIVASKTIYACSMCRNGTCSSQVSGSICRSGVRAWLMDKSREYLAAFEEEQE